MTSSVLVPETRLATMARARVVLEDGASFDGWSFGHRGGAAGEVVFSTGMVGYPESLTDPSFYGQILAFTFPMIGNYGVPGRNERDGISPDWESARVQVSGLIVSDYSTEHSHWNALTSLGEWLDSHKVPGVMGVDTRALTKRLREKGTMLGKIEFDGIPIEFDDPNSRRIVEDVCVKEPRVYGSNGPRVMLIDCGCKESIIGNLVSRGFTVKRVPWNYDVNAEDWDALVISSGPGDPKLCNSSIHHIRAALRRDKPVLGICLGHQLMALAIGADTFKLKYGHRGQNQPVRDVRTRRCYITSQNHGFAVDAATLPDDWETWMENLNDGTNEGIRHRSKPFMSIQFHPEANPGPVDTRWIFDEFAGIVRR